MGLGKTGFYDQDIYDGSNNKYEGYVTSIAANDEIEVISVIFHFENTIFNCVALYFLRTKITNKLRLALIRDQVTMHPPHCLMTLHR